MYRSHPVVTRAFEGLHDDIPPGGVGIHGKIYDIRHLDHPGGALWMDLCRATDCTELYELSHVNIQRSNAALAALPVLGTYTRKHTWSFDNYAKVRSVALEALPTRQSRRQTREQRGALWVHVGLGGLLHAATMASYPLTLAWTLACFASAASNCVMGGYGHNALHQLSPLALGLDWNGLSSFEWCLEHICSHHCYTNSKHDHDAISMHPFVEWTGRRRWHNVLIYAIFPLGELLVAAQGYVGHRCRWKCPPTAPAWMRYAPYLFLLRAATNVIAHGFAGLATLAFTCAIASAYFSLLAHLNHAPLGGDADDFLAHQLRTTADLRSFAPPELALGLDRQTLHHLFPTVDHSRLDGALRRRLASALPKASLEQHSVGSLLATMHARLW